MPRSPNSGVSDVSAPFVMDTLGDTVADVAAGVMPMLWTPHRPARPDKTEGGRKFKLVSDYQPAGDQPTGW